MSQKAFLRKVVGCLLIMIMLASLTACGGKPQETTATKPTPAETTKATTAATTTAEPVRDLGGRTIKIGSYNQLIVPQESNPNYAKIMDLLESVQKKYNCKFENVVPEGGLTAFSDLLNTQIAAGNIEYDVFNIHVYRISPHAQILGTIAPIDDYVDLTDPRLDHSMMESSKYKGKIYGFRAAVPENGLFFLFNKKVLSDNGIDPQTLYDLASNGKWTFEKLREYALRCAKDTGDPATSIYGVGFYGWFWTVANYIYANDSSLTVGQDENTKINLDDPKAIEALQFLYNLMYVDKVVSPSTAVWDNDKNLFLNNQMAFYNTYYWHESNLKTFKERLGENLGILPMVKGKEEYEITNTGATSLTYFFNAKSKDIDIIVKAVTEYLTGLRDISYPPDQEFVFADNPSVQTNLDFDENNIKMLRLLNLGKTIYYPVLGEEFRTKVTESGFGLYGGEEPRAWVEANKAMAQQLINDLYSK